MKQEILTLLQIYTDEIVNPSFEGVSNIRVQELANTIKGKEINCIPVPVIQHGFEKFEIIGDQTVYHAVIEAGLDKVLCIMVNDKHKTQIQAIEGIKEVEENNDEKINVNHEITEEIEEMEIEEMEIEEMKIEEMEIDNINEEGILVGICEEVKEEILTAAMFYNVEIDIAKMKELSDLNKKQLQAIASGFKIPVNQNKKALIEELEYKLLVF